ncbi:MAG: hypothetical protein ACTHK0_01875 [Ginsengibacter sp.]
MNRELSAGTTDEISANVDFSTSATLATKPNVIGGFVQRVRKLFHVHTVVSFKCGRFPLVAGYCSKCGAILFGNALYYDGTYFQHIYHGDEAEKFLKEQIETIIDNTKSFNFLKEKTNVLPLYSYREQIQGLVSNHETVETYNKILELVKRVNRR